MLKGNSLEEQLRKWRESKAEQHASVEKTVHAAPAAPLPKERRTVRVNGQDVVVVKKVSRRVVPKHPES